LAVLSLLVAMKMKGPGMALPFLAWWVGERPFSSRQPVASVSCGRPPRPATGAVLIRRQPLGHLAALMSARLRSLSHRRLPVLRGLTQPDVRRHLPRAVPIRITKVGIQHRPWVLPQNRRPLPRLALAGGPRVLQTRGCRLAHHDRLARPGRGVLGHRRIAPFWDALRDSLVRPHQC
jgi:hypothetical protein